jgi:chemotaxis protein CheZ
MHCDASGFDTGHAAAAKKPRKPRARKGAAAGLPVELPALIGSTEPGEGFPAGFETVASATPASASAPGDAPNPADEVYVRIGHLTRTLHNALRELGYDKDLMQTREHLPDARDRLAYIARVTGEAAEKVLNAVDRARTVQEQLTQQAHSLNSRWQAVAAYTGGSADRATPAGRQLVAETCDFFAGVGGQADATQAILTDIMMAQDFHDLTGQVIRKVVGLATNMEEQLVKLLLETTPPEQRRKVEAEKLEGPIVNADGRMDVVTDQAQVDDLLASLGF